MVQRFDHANNVLKLAIGFGSEADKRAYKVDVKGINLSKNTYYRGQVIERIIGKVWKTRHDVLLDAGRALEPDFDLRSQTISVGEQQIPNPLMFYEDLLDRHVNGSLSKVHGDLHLGNILVGPNNSTWLIDFAHTRDGHALFDWASLEVSVLGDGVMNAVGNEWDTVRKVASYLAALDARTIAPSVSSEVFAGMASVTVIREIARDCLTTKDNWQEYYVALALCALRATTWTTLTLGGRRLMFLLAGLSMLELTRRSVITAQETPSPDAADRTDQLPDVVSTHDFDTLNPASGGEVNPANPPPRPLLQHLAATRQLEEPVDASPDEPTVIPHESDQDSSSDAL